MLIRRFALPAVIATSGLSGLMALGAMSAHAAALRTDPGGALLNINTTIRNTASTPAVLTTALGNFTCTQTTVIGRASSNTGAIITGTGQGTYTSCTDTVPVINIQSCRGHGAFPTLSVTAIPGGGTITTGDAVVRCAIAGSSSACYFTSATAVGYANNAASSITYSNVAVTSITSPTTDALGGCPSSGSFSVTLLHGVNQSNQTLTITTS